jgi:lipopolysaccharide/colanic/teichoic acid biosynthesis glycosyltransferase
MSLVGPRPPLPAEVERYDVWHRRRLSMKPGITGLWQVEARDNPSFEAYRRLDLFYVENWSITLDLLIIIGTIEQLTLKVFSMIRPRRPVDTPSIPTLAQANAFTAETRSEAS